MRMMRKYGKVEDRLRRLGARMKRIITTTVLVLFIIALPALGNLTEYQMGFSKGLEAGFLIGDLKGRALYS